MNILENELEHLIYEASKTKGGREQLAERGLDFISSPLIRQLNLEPYGIPDLICVEFTEKYYKCIEFHIIELKKESINKDTFFQAFGYAVGIRRMLGQSQEFKDYALSFTLHLIGKSLDTSTNFCFLSD